MGSYLAELHAICCRSIPQFPSPASHACCISASVIQLSPANRLHYLFLKTASSKMRFLHTALLQSRAVRSVVSLLVLLGQEQCNDPDVRTSRVCSRCMPSGKRCLGWM